MQLKYKITSLFTLLSALIVIIISIIAYHNFDVFSQERYREKMQTQSHLVAYALNERLTRFFDVLDSATFFFNEDGQLELKTANVIVENIANTIDGEIGIYLGLMDGSLIMNGELVANFNALEKQREWFLRPLAGERHVISKAYLSSTKNIDVFGLSVPIFHEKKVAAVLMINIPVQFFTELAATLTPNNQMFVYRQDGYIISSQYSDYIGKNIFELRPKYTSLSEQNASVSYTVDKGSFYAVSAKSKSYDWTVTSYEKIHVIAQSSLDNLFDSLWVIIISLILLSIIIYQIVIKLIYIPIGGEPLEISKLVKQVADGNLRLEQTVTGKEIGIYGNVLAMITNLRGIIIHINQYSEELNHSSTSLSSSALAMSVSSKSQTEQLEQTATAMNEMTSTVDEVARSALNAANSASSATENSILGIKLVDDMNVNINALVDDMNDVSSVIANVAAETNNIGSILDVIKGIADQTNLLALNAAIEAARAGEYGRGFAVVADEVRGLATRTQSSTNEISTMIDKLQTQAKLATEQMSANTNNAQLTSGKTQEANNSLKQIADSVSVIHNMNDHIATASEQQTLVASEINQSVIQINDSARLTYEQSEKTTLFAQELGAMAKALNQVVGQFKL